MKIKLLLLLGKGINHPKLPNTKLNAKQLIQSPINIWKRVIKKKKVQMSNSLHQFKL